MTAAEREALTNKLLAYIGDWEQDSIFCMIESLLDELPDAKLEEFVKSQGIQ